MYRIFFVNHGYYHESSYATALEALEAAKGFHFDAAIMRGEGDAEALVAGWSVFGGIKFYDESERATFHAIRIAEGRRLRKESA